MLLRTSLTLALFSLPLVAQGPWSPRVVGELSAYEFSLGTSASEPARGLGLSEADRSLLALLRGRSPAPIEREDLERSPVEGPGFDALPGGIVLGLTAVPQGDWSGARVSVDDRGLSLVLGDGTGYRLPEAPWETLAVCLAFSADGAASDAVVDICERQVHLAPAFEGTGLARVVERADRAPLEFLPSWGEKAMIVYRRVTFGIDREQPGRLELLAELEIRLFVARDSWTSVRRARCVATYPLERGADGVTRLAGAPLGTFHEPLVERVQPIAELAALIGFFRWVRERDPAGFVSLRERLAELAATRLAPPSPFETLLPVR